MRKKPAKKSPKALSAQEQDVNDLIALRKSATEVINAAFAVSLELELPCCARHAEDAIWRLLSTGDAFSRQLHKQGYRHAREVVGLFRVELVQPPRGHRNDDSAPS